MSTDRVTTVTAYSVTEAARKIGISRSTINRAIRDGKLAVHKSSAAHGPSLVYSADLLDYVLSFRGGDGVPGA